jgi:predicted transcriptional regulator
MDMPRIDLVRVHPALPRRLRDWLNSYSKVMGVSRSVAVQRALEQFQEREEKKLDKYRNANDGESE